MTVLAFERHPVDEGCVPAFEELLEALVSAAREAPGVLWADAFRAFDDAPSYVVMSEWRTEADLDAFEGAEAAASFDEEADPLRRADPTRRRLRA